MNDYINEKIQHLYDFCILIRQGRKHDEREKTVRKILKTCTTKTQVDIMLSDMTRRGMSVDKFIKLKEGMINA